MWINRKEWDNLCAEVRRLKEQRADDQAELTQRISMSADRYPGSEAYSPHGFRYEKKPVTEVVQAILNHLKLDLTMTRVVPERLELRERQTTTLTFTGEVTPPKRARKSRTK